MAYQGAEIRVNSRFVQGDCEEDPAFGQGWKRRDGRHDFMENATERKGKNFLHAPMGAGGDYDQWLHGSSNSFKRVWLSIRRENRGSHSDLRKSAGPLGEKRAVQPK